jgi:phospholipid-binding lipoprotein MlaA
MEAKTMSGNNKKVKFLGCGCIFIFIIWISMVTVVVAEETTENPEAFMDLFEEDDAKAAISVADPIAPWNRAMFVFNDKCYFWVLKPVASGYKAVMPKPARKGVNNFFYNLTTPIRFTNCILQGKGNSATAEFFRFLLNTTVGVLGFGNPAGKYPSLNPDAEDLGQTFGRYGVGNGIYIVWPLLGPSTLRDSVGLFGDRFLNPTSYVDPSIAATGIEAYKIINNVSLKIGDYEALKEVAVEPYIAFRAAYVQYRQDKVEK